MVHVVGHGQMRRGISKVRRMLEVPVRAPHVVDPCANKSVSGVVVEVLSPSRTGQGERLILLLCLPTRGVAHTLHPVWLEELTRRPVALPYVLEVALLHLIPKSSLLRRRFWKVLVRRRQVISLHTRLLRSLASNSNF